MITGDLDVQFVEATKCAAEGCFRALPIGRKAVYIALPVQKVECSECQAFRQVKIRFAGKHRRYIRAFERLALDGVNEKTYLKIHKLALQILGLYIPRPRIYRNQTRPILVIQAITNELQCFPGRKTDILRYLLMF